MAAEDNDDIFQEDDNNDVDNKKIVIDPIKVSFKNNHVADCCIVTFVFCHARS